MQNLLKSETIIQFMDLRKIIKLCYENFIKFDSYYLQKKVSEVIKDFIYTFKNDKEKVKMILEEFLCKETMYLALKSSHMHRKINVILIFNSFDTIGLYY